VRNGLRVEGLMPSPLRGPAGNVEFLLLLTWRGEVEGDELDPRLLEMIETCLSKTHGCEG